MSIQQQDEFHPTRVHAAQALLFDGQILIKVRVVVTFGGVVAGRGTKEGVGAEGSHCLICAQVTRTCSFVQIHQCVHLISVCLSVGVLYNSTKNFL